MIFKFFERMKLREIRRQCKCITTNYLRKPDGD